MDELNNQNVKIIEHASFDDIQSGDYVIRERTEECDDLIEHTRHEGIAHHLDTQGRWCTEKGVWLAWRGSEDATLTIHRTVKELPTKPKAVIVANDGHDAVAAVFNGVVYHAREAVLIGWGLWQGAWRAAGDVQYYMTPSQITSGTWKVDGE